MQHDQISNHAAFILRLSLGIMFVAHASLKVFVFTMAGTVGFFESIGPFGCAFHGSRMRGVADGCNPA